MLVERGELTFKQKVFRFAALAVAIGGVALIGFSFVTEAVPANFDPSSPKFKGAWPNRRGWVASYSFESCSGLFCEPQNPESTSSQFSGIVDVSKDNLRCPTLQYSHLDRNGSPFLHTSTWRLIPGTCEEL